MDDLILETVVPGPGGLLVIGRSEPPKQPLQSFWLDGATNEQAGRLEGWTAAGMPLLEMRTGDGTVTLHGPTSCVSGLRLLPSSKDFAARSEILS
jgi:hypothetical protein